MTEHIVRITGNVAHPVTMDPGVWIFDERRVHLDTVFSAPEEAKVISDAEKMAKAWNRQRSGTNPQSNQNIVHLDKRDLTEHSLGIHLAPFLQNASPLDDASIVTVRTSQNERVELDMDTAFSAILAFSHEGKALKEDGPVHLYFADGSNRDAPIRYVTELIVS
ncbi:hypothetical protein [Salisediminibacterium beveridgei]|uniref:Peptidyl-prolyl cis-trans isomerase n=1 Tax=Salisediminibacterium beveridgei TaxID=632773 RepID=A0A1D7QWC8_9BACI|nr:hypothetical protein [Salisediminibacterium beveridgei]AOM83306.1 hypothetical protein BBEV_1945 [Salisediminibacterium beveridgei]